MCWLALGLFTKSRYMKMAMHSCLGAQPTNKKGDCTMQSKTFQVPSISCGHCVKTIQNEIRDLDGVSTVQADQDTKMVTVEWDAPATWETIKATLVEINYPPASEN
jgi:copper chaperone